MFRMKNVAARGMVNFDQTPFKPHSTIRCCAGFLGDDMKRQYLHLSVYACDECKGPVVTGSLAVRENEISKETDIRQVGAICLSCGRRQNRKIEAGVIRAFPPVEWETVNLLANCAAASHRGD
jgi:hypothetical protein